MHPHLPISKILGLAAFYCLIGSAQGQAGSVDLSFDPGAGIAPSAPQDIFVRPDGRVIVIGPFQTYDGFSVGGIAGVNTDGSMDASFVTGTGFEGGNAWRILEQPGGKLLCLGSFTSYNGYAADGLVRMYMDGTIDTTFQVDEDVNAYLAQDMAIHADGRIVLGGLQFLHDDNYFCLLSPNGQVNPTWGSTKSPYQVNDVELCPDSVVTFAANAMLGRLLPSNGWVDGIFDAAVGEGPNSIAKVLHMLPDCRAYVGGTFTAYDGYSLGRIVRVNYDGTRDTTFDTGTGANFHVEHIITQPDGKVLVAGAFNTFSDVTSWKMVRLFPDGSLDPSFNVGQGPFVSGDISQFALLPDGKILVVGGYTTFNNVPRLRIARLNGDGGSLGSSNLSALPPLRISMAANGDVVLLGLEQETREVQVLNLNGQVVLRTTTTGLVPTGRLAAGAYVLTALDPSNQVVQRAKVVRD